MNISQLHVDSLEKWIDDRQDAYLKKGLHLAALAGIESLAEFREDHGLSEEDMQKSLPQIKAELSMAEEFFKDARQILFAGRQGG